MTYLEQHQARQDQRAYRDLLNIQRYHPKYGQLFQGMDGIELFGVPMIAPDDGSYPDKLDRILKTRIDMVTDQDSQWYSQLIYGNNNYRQQLVRQMTNEFDTNDIPNLISDIREYSPVINDLNPHKLLVKFILPIDPDWTILNYRLPEEFDEKSRDGLKIDLASPKDIENWLKTNKIDISIEHGRALVLTYEVPTVSSDEIQSSFQSISTELEIDLGWIESLLKHFRITRKKHWEKLIRGVAAAVAKKVDIYSKVYEQLESVQITESSIQQRPERPETRSGRIFKPWLVDVHGCMCAGCDRIFCYDRLEVDHVIPWSMIKTTKYENLQLLCVPCNRLKANDSMEEFRRKLGEQGGPMNDACCDGNH